MITKLEQFFAKNWQQKVMALIAAVVIWLLTSHATTVTRTVANIPVKIINIPADKTVEGILPSGYLSEHITLTLTGTKSVLESLTPSDFEVIIDAYGKPHEWVATISKKNLSSLNPDINFVPNITKVSHNELIIKLSKLVTAKIPIKINTPVGEPPHGYLFLDVWPQQLTYTLSGPEEQVADLKAKGLSLTFDLSMIKKSELDALASSEDRYQKDEVTFFIPDSWKKVMIPFHDGAKENITDPEAKKLHITFLKKSFISLDHELPVRIFYPLNYTNTINPDTYVLADNYLVKKKNGLKVLQVPLLVRDVSQLFLDVVQNNIELTVIAAPKTVTDVLKWTVEFVDHESLEKDYISRILSHTSEAVQSKNIHPTVREAQLRERFRHYMQAFKLFKASDELFLLLDIELQGNGVTIEDVTDVKKDVEGNENSNP